MNDYAELVCSTGASAGHTIKLSKPKMVLGRDRESCDLVLTQPFISKHQAAFETDDHGRIVLRDLGSKYGTHVNGRAITELTLSPGDRIGFGPGGILVFTYSPISSFARLDGTNEAGALSPAEISTNQTLQHANVRQIDNNTSTTFSLPANTALNIGRAADNDIVLSGAGVSRHHARLTLTPHSQPVIADIGSTNGTYVNGDLLRAPRSLEADDVVFLGGFLFRVDGATIHQIDLGASRISAFSLSKEYSGEPVMSDISLALLPGEFVGLMGPSGCGKSTLMDALDGLQPAPVGSVFLGDFDLYRNFGSVRRSIGHVPQHDVLHDDLSVERTLLYAARLRLPATTQRAQIRAVVADVVNMVSLQDKLATPFRNLSGGQQKRLSIAIELLTMPTFLFLDEPTSPLDPETTEDLMGRLRKLADQGRIVVMITHKFEKFELMDQVALLAKGGHLAFFGPPQLALKYFGCRESGNIFRSMSHSAPEDLDRRFRASAEYRRFVNERVSESRALIQDAPSRRASTATPPSLSLHDQVAQWWTLTQRYFEIKLKDRRNAAILLVQPPIFALILVLLFGSTSNDAKTLFISAIIAVWFGANSAIREIVAEMPIYQRERRFSLQIAPYVLSKFAVLSVIGLAQCIAFLAILTGFHLVDRSDFPILISILYLTTLGGISTALFFSAIVNSTDKALSILPLILIPQLLLSGFMKPVDDVYFNPITEMPVSAAAYRQSEDIRPTQANPVRLVKRDGLGAGKILSAIMLARWSIDGLVHAVSVEDQRSRDRLATQLYVAGYASVLAGKDSSSVKEAYLLRVWLDLVVLLAFSLVLLPLTMWTLKRRDVL